MKIQVHVSDVKVGMFIHDICANWMDYPFWSGPSAINSSDDLKKLKNCGIKYVWIDPSKGLGAESCNEVLTQEDENRKISSVLHDAMVVTHQSGRCVNLNEELDSARKILANARKQVVTMFHEARMGKALQVDGAMTVVDEVNRSITRNSNALLSLVRLKNKNDYTYMHSVAVCALMIALGKQLGIEGEQLQLLGMAGLFHDIGKAMIPAAVLNKPGKLTDEEFAIIKKHPTLGWKILKKLPDFHDVILDVALHHHERIDGAGYPGRRQGEALTLAARMAAVCDVYDAITSARCYKNAWEPAEAIRKMASWQCGNFDLQVFHAFVKTVGIYPVGTLVKLKSGRMAVVIEQTEKSLITPIVKAFFSVTSKMFITPEILNLDKLRDSIESIEAPDKWGFNLQTVIETLN
ncbi:HD-GYP domain-containing protein [Candidatus Methylospira mobilis]|uniref:HD-GYP domain-containing protein n=1 Tax=Candidatus Methylospira mobilis TaxID=1808979 RepID=A0A5Q0BNF3_9GAMM|nr:HD-GYP domain-containing protein [Candidatus Methylospira mobilis]QFY43761.1 HD-GYP domain-containing protein [Candidatus Methylospira mobilis]WNV04750.1 HD-GYP domain-containing protein [Candidatus Methylospira mobilis]